MAERTFRVWRGDAEGGEFKDYAVELDRGMVVLDALHLIQAQHAGDLAVRWNCKAGKCGSCSMEINGRPRLSCMTRINEFGSDELITVRPIKTFPVLKDLVTDVSWNYDQNKRIKPFKPKKKDADGNYRMMQRDVERVQEFRKCIECYLCQNVCHVLRDQDRKDAFVGPRFMIRVASLEMHPLDVEDRVPETRDELGSGMCNITRCCTDVCPEHIQITDNGIIPMKERVVDRYYDPLLWLLRKITGSGKKKASIDSES
ncbi:MAG: succinate dehydrogenase/fumarate reductase iron-sulfur subunit [Opitutae bacterium]|nr:succinate dehydrogenase/fumarate reductase iron-sulfur subunit [Opitutae bacterium]|tara:strand:+ start:1684 stop:2457 length:774 start_codon:yes stop_codon:yes gene_type:complete